jgi:PIN domain nuclease of toxin-antitoxin system
MIVAGRSTQDARRIEREPGASGCNVSNQLSKPGNGVFIAAISCKNIVIAVKKQEIQLSVLTEYQPAVKATAIQILVETPNKTT